jgi:hypothetical protein
MPTENKPDAQLGKKPWRVADVVQRQPFTMLEPMEPVNLTEEQKKLRVVDVAQRERFTMLEEKGPNDLTPEKTGWPVIGIEESAPGVGTSDLATIQGLIDRLGAARLQQIVGALAAGGAKESR